MKKNDNSDEGAMSILTVGKRLVSGRHGTRFYKKLIIIDDERAMSIRKHYRKEGNQSNYITRDGIA